MGRTLSAALVARHQCDGAEASEQQQRGDDRLLATDESDQEAEPDQRSSQHRVDFPFHSEASPIPIHRGRGGGNSQPAKEMTASAIQASITTSTVPSVASTREGCPPALAAA
jgi:hypothetical protein